MVLLVFVVAGCGWLCAKAIRYFWRTQRIGRLQPPLDMLDEFRRPGTATASSRSGSSRHLDGSDENVELLAARSRYSRAQARQRFRRGKS